LSPGRYILQVLSPCPDLSWALLAHNLSIMSPYKSDDVGGSGAA